MRCVRVSFQPPAHFEAIQSGHHHIEENGVGWVLPDELQCLLSILRLSDEVASGNEWITQQRAVVLVIIDHQNFTLWFRMRHECQRAHCNEFETELLPWFAAAEFRNPATVCENVRVLIGFVRYPAQPAANAFSSSPFMACAVNAITGMCRVAGS